MRNLTTVAASISNCEKKCKQINIFIVFLLQNINNIKNIIQYG